VKSAQQVRIRAAQSLGASRAQVLWLVILPGALPEILTGLRIGLGVGWSTLVAAELIAATRGLGLWCSPPVSSSPPTWCWRGSR
jgi:taurine transport system permease protein